MTRFSKPPAPTIQGETVTLRQLNIDYLDDYLRFLAEPEAQRLTATKTKFTREKIVDWLSTRPTQTDRCDWAIVDSTTAEFLGEVVLNEFNADKQSMNLRIALAHPSLYGQGIGKETLRIVLRYAFFELSLEQVRLEVLVDNGRAVKAYSKVGFIPKREFNEGKHRFLRMTTTKLDFMAAEVQRLMRSHLGKDIWRFEYDSGKRRAGACHYNERLITLSRYYVYLNDYEETWQVMLHEIAHALCTSADGHGPKWKKTATAIGYRHQKLDGSAVADFAAPWVGTCPGGHTFHRYRKPTRASSCDKCHKGGYSEAHRIVWQQR